MVTQAPFDYGLPGLPRQLSEGKPLWQGTSQDGKWRVRSLVKRQVLIT